MVTKLIRDLQTGDVVKIVEPEGKARVSHIERSRLFQAVGGCFRIDLTVTDGPHKGEKIRDQHHSGSQEIELV